METIHDRLEAAFVRYSVERQLNDVPPHEVYEVTVDGERAVCKVDTGPTGSAEVEGRVTAFVGERTSVPVPDILHVGEEHYVAAWHPAAPAPDDPTGAGETWASAAGRGLATLHEETEELFERYGRFEPHDGGVVPAGDRDWHAGALEYVERHRPVLETYGHADVADTVQGFLQERPDAFAGAGGPVCCHGWATPEHVAVRDGEVTCMVDFEHAIAAPGEFDYWRTSLPAFGPDTGAAGRSFRDGYESVRPLPANHSRRRPLYVLLNLVYYFESLYVQNQHGPAETAERAEGLRNAVMETIEEFG